MSGKNFSRAQVGTGVLNHNHPEIAGAEYVVFADASRRYRDCSDGVCRLLGYERSEILNKTIEEVSFHGKEVPALFAQYLERGRMEGEYVLRHKSGVPVPIRFKAYVFSDGCNAAVWDPITDWRQSYLEALVELNPVKLRKKTEIAQAALSKRLSEADASIQERQELRDASSAIQSMIRNFK